LKVIVYGNPILRKSAKSVDRITKEIRESCEQMLVTMKSVKPKGVGLAGPQVGIPLRIFVMEPEVDSVFFIANPQILKSTGSVIESEGCLSVPGVYYKVKRAEKILVSYIDIITGKKHKREFEKYAARVFQHETDHLNGIVFTDYCQSIDELEFQENIKIPPKLLERFKS
jgi:peptide deformylase